MHTIATLLLVVAVSAPGGHATVSWRDDLPACVYRVAPGGARGRLGCATGSLDVDGYALMPGDLVEVRAPQTPARGRARVD